MANNLLRSELSYRCCCFGCVVVAVVGAVETCLEFVIELTMLMMIAISIMKFLIA